jgi:hypothetical protein
MILIVTCGWYRIKKAFSFITHFNRVNIAKHVSLRGGLKFNTRKLQCVGQSNMHDQDVHNSKIEQFEWNTRFIRIQFCNSSKNLPLLCFARRHAPHFYLIQSATILDTFGSSLRTAIFKSTPDASPDAATCALANTFVPPTNTPLR